jgi:predicted transcriptional regulator
MPIVDPSPFEGTSQSQADERKLAAVPIHHWGRLGEREREVMEIVWAIGTATVHQVNLRLPGQLTYTTVMTTLDRLFKKGLLHRVKRDRSFVYSPALSPKDVEDSRAHSFVQRFFADAASRQDMLLTCLVDAIGNYDDDMLKQLEEKVNAAKKRLENPTSSEPQEGS